MTTKLMMVGVAVVSMGSVGACEQGGAPTGSSAALSVAELQATVASGASAVELQLVDGVAREVHAQPVGNDEHLEGYVVAVDAVAGTILLDDIGVVDFGQGTRFRTEDESHASREAWLAEVTAGSFIRASRLTPDEPQAPEDARFFATDLRIEDGDGRSKIELSIDSDNLLLDPPSLMVLGQAFDLSTLQASDDGTPDQGGGNDDDLPGDDNGGDDDGTADQGGGNDDDLPGDDNGGDDDGTADQGGGNDDDLPGDDNGGDDDGTADQGGGNDDDLPGDDNGGDDDGTADQGGGNDDDLPGDDNGGDDDGTPDQGGGNDDDLPGDDNGGDDDNGGHGSDD